MPGSGAGPMVSGVSETLRIALIALAAIVVAKLLTRVVKPLAPVAAFL